MPQAQWASRRTPSVGVLLFVALLLCGGTPGLPAPAAAGAASFSPSLYDQAAALPLPDRIAFWAEAFIGRPYDPDPLGEYVRRSAVVADERMDCLYHVFRSVELARGGTAEQAVAQALQLRFHHAGQVQEGRVINYDDRFQYGEDMIDSGKWGREVTAALGPTTAIPGSRGRERVTILPKAALLQAETQARLRNGDLLFLIKDPKKRVAGEIVGHLGILVARANTLYLVHASGRKTDPTAPLNGAVKRVKLTEYAAAMPFLGARVTRFEE
ncbi:MAG: hypothetical protein HZA23_06615 [Nitrospirae bacterium]|nr:hypothetical protein [Nitrospirota bacterium]